MRDVAFRFVFFLTIDFCIRPICLVLDLIPSFAVTWFTFPIASPPRAQVTPFVSYFELFLRRR